MPFCGLHTDLDRPRRRKRHCFSAKACAQLVESCLQSRGEKPGLPSCPGATAGGGQERDTLWVCYSRKMNKALKQQWEARDGGPRWGQTQRLACGLFTSTGLAPSGSLSRGGDKSADRWASHLPGLHNHPLCQMGKLRLRAARPSWEVAPLGLDLECMFFPLAVFQTFSSP